MEFVSRAPQGVDVLETEVASNAEETERRNHSVDDLEAEMASVAEVIERKRNTKMWTLVEYWSQPSSGYRGIYKKGDQCALAFSGSITPDDWIKNGRWGDKNVGDLTECGLSRVHGGFLSKIKTFILGWHKLQEYLADPENCQGPLLVTGHSLGGALASLFTACAHMIPRPSFIPEHIAGSSVHLFTYGAPAVSKDQIVSRFTNNGVFPGAGARFYISDWAAFDPIPYALQPLGFVHPRIAAVRLNKAMGRAGSATRCSGDSVEAMMNSKCSGAPNGMLHAAFMRVYSTRCKKLLKQGEAASRLQSLGF